MGVPDNVENKKHEEKVIEILQNIEVNVSTKELKLAIKLENQKITRKKLLFISLIKNMQRKLFSIEKG